MEAVYLMERTSPGSAPLLSPRWLTTSGPRRRLPMARIDTTTATTQFSHTPEASRLSIDSASPRTPDKAGEFTPFPSPSTAFTTPATSPLRSKAAEPHPKPQKPTGILDEPDSSLEKVTLDAEALKAWFNVWVERYMAEVIRNNQLREELHRIRGQLTGA